MIKPARIVVLFPLLLLLAGRPAAGRDYITINDPNFRPYPLALAPWKDLGGGRDIVDKGYDILRSDMSITGVFKLLDPRSFIADPRQEGLSSASIKFADWINVGAEGLVKVGVVRKGKEVILDCHLFDVAAGKEVLGRKIRGPAGDLRRLVHTFADALIRHFTGTPSVFFTRIVFAKKTNQRTKEICIMDFDGFHESCVVRNGSINLLPAWSSDGRGIFYSSYLHGGPHLYYLDLRTRKSRVVSKSPGLNIGVSACPDGKRIALTLSRDENAEIYSMNTDGSNPRRLTRDWAIDSSPAWSPDAKRLAFVSERAGTPQIYVMQADGSGVRRLTFKGNYNQTPDWSPRGDWILFNARDERLVYDIFRINPESGEIVRLTQDQGHNEHPSFSPDGNLVVFSSTRTGESKLYIMNADGTNQRLISRRKGEYTTPEWGPWLEK